MVTLLKKTTWESLQYAKVFLLSYKIQKSTEDALDILVTMFFILLSYYRKHYLFLGLNTWTYNTDKIHFNEYYQFSNTCIFAFHSCTISIYIVHLTHCDTR